MKSEKYWQIKGKNAKYLCFENIRNKKELDYKKCYHYLKNNDCRFKIITKNKNIKCEYAI